MKLLINKGRDFTVEISDGDIKESCIISLPNKDINVGIHEARRFAIALAKEIIDSTDRCVKNIELRQVKE